MMMLILDERVEDECGVEWVSEGIEEKRKRREREK